MRLVTGLAVLAAMALLTGCGGGAEPRPAAAPEAAPPPVTTTAPSKRPAKPKAETQCMRAKAPGYRMCETIRGLRMLRATIEVRAGDGWRVITREPQGAFRRKTEWWGWKDVWPSPDGRTLLAELGGECDTHYSFFVPANGGPPRPVTGESNWRASPPSLPRGWSADGRARVWVLSGGGCSHEADVEPGRYLIDPVTGELDYVQPLPAPYRS